MSMLIEDWKSFEKEVAALFKLQGYAVEENIQISGKKVEVFAQKRASPFTVERLAIDCKFYTSTLPRSEVTEVIGTVPALLGSGQCDRVVIVSNSPPSEPTMKLVQDTKNLSFMLYEELLAGLIDFGPYIWKFTRMFESNELFDSYVPAIGHEENGKEHFDIIERVNSWIEQGRPFHCSILGDYGIGKTSIATMLTYVMMKKYNNDPSRNLIPIYLPLRDYSKSFDARAMITDHLVNAYSLHTDYSAFSLLLERGKLLVILDGFDEMSQTVDSDIRRQHFLALADLSRGESKTIITGRIGYFPAADDVREMTSLIKKEGEIQKEGAKRYFTVFVEPFSKSQVSNYIRKKASYLKERGISHWTEVRDIVFQNPNLFDLSSRPVLLSMLVKTAPIFKNQLPEINIVGLYDQYTQMWMDRDYNKGNVRRLLNQEVKEKMMEGLALEMFIQGVRTFEIEKLRSSIKPIAERLKVPVVDRQFDYVEHDIRVCTFLTMDYKENCYRFAHQSFLEFFVARALLDIVKNGLIDETLAKQFITDEILAFLAEMIRNENEVEDTVETIRQLVVGAEEVKNMPVIQAGPCYFTNVLRIFCSLSRGFPNLKLNNLKLPFLKLENKDLIGADVRSCALSDTLLKKVKLSDCRFDNSNIRRSNFVDCVILNGTFVDSVVVATKFHNCQMEGCNFSRTSMGGVDFSKCNLSKSRFSGANIRWVDFIDVDLSGCDFIGCKIDKDTVRIIRSNVKGVRGLTPQNLRFIQEKSVTTVRDVPNIIASELPRTMTPRAENRKHKTKPA